ncbi:hypothetical protein DL95DRAFT_168745 [Leptodontidium sp. 2 PMI_412]|nr:hypothetical protein BKA61DRAFT_77715 [Leptodontidium sp. MPI-SDFR-AT-0119]KAH9213071.1 hypothetical protein DL95DRAFT_168745 [Leptodontidium sp. 2 PMI_412]
MNRTVLHLFILFIHSSVRLGAGDSKFNVPGYQTHQSSYQIRSKRIRSSISQQQTKKDLEESHQASQVSPISPLSPSSLPLISSRPHFSPITSQKRLGFPNTTTD